MARHPVEVRPATADDLDALLVLWAQARAEMVAAGRHVPVVPADAVRARLVDVLSDRRLDVLLAVQDDEALGFALVRTAGLNPLVTMPVLQVDQLFVASTARRRGVGKALVAAAAAAADRAGVDQVVCNIDKPFVLNGRMFGVEFSGGLSGTYRFVRTPNIPGLSWKAKGSYSISFPNGEDKPGSMATNGDGTIHAGSQSRTTSGGEHFTLTPVESCDAAS